MNVEIGNEPAHFWVYMYQIFRTVRSTNHNIVCLCYFARYTVNVVSIKNHISWEALAN
jgi:hypothetical protein